MNQRIFHSARRAFISRRSWACLALALLAANATGCDQRSAPDQVANAARAAEIRETLGGSADSGPTEFDEEPTGFVTFSGSVTLAGAPPANPALTMDRDLNVCAPGGRQVSDTFPEVVVGEGGGLANFLIFLNTKLPDDPEWIHLSARPGREGMAEFDQEKCMFLSPMFAFQTSQTLRILNSDPIGHNTNGSPKSNSNFNPNLPAGGHYDVTFSAQEKAPFTVACSIHTWMRAHMICRDNGYFAVTDADGNFTISNLPADIDLEFKIWHEACEYRLSEIEIDGSNVSLGRGGKLPQRFSLEDGDQDVQIVIDASQLSR